MRTDEQILKQTNELANKLYGHLGYIEREKFKFYNATHPIEIMCWNMACEAQLLLTATDVSDINYLWED